MSAETAGSRAPDDTPALPHVEAEDLLSTSAAGPAAVRGGALRMVSFMTTALMGVATAALLFRHLGVVDTGRYTTALVLSAVVTGLTDLGLTAVGMREWAVLDTAPRARLGQNLLGIRLVLTSLGVAGITLFADLAYDHVAALAVLIAGVGVIVQSIQATLQVPLLAGLRLGWVSLLEVARQAVGSVLIVALVLLGASLLPFLATISVAAAAVLVPTAVLVRREFPLRPAFNMREWAALLRPVFTYSIAVAASTLYFRVALVLVSLLGSGTEVGYFSVPYRVVEVLFVIPGLVVSAAFPIFARAARDDPQRLGYAISRVFEVMLIAGVWVSLTLAIGAEFVIRVIGGPDFLPASSVLAIQGVAVGATFVNAVWGFGMLSLALHRLILIYSLSTLALVAVVVGVLVPLDGAHGAAIGVAGVEVVAAIAAGLLLTHGRPHLKPGMRVPPRVVLAALLGATPALATGLPVLVRTVLAATIYIVVILALGALPEELYDVLPTRLRPRARA